MRINYLIIVWMFCLSLGMGLKQAVAQEPVISVVAHHQPLSEVLGDITTRYGIRFAFDAESFQNKETSCDFNEITLSGFLEYIGENHQVSSKLIDGTWILVIRNMNEVMPDPLHAKAKNLSGYVSDRRTGERLMYCNIMVGDYRGGTTNELGFFNFGVSNPDSVRILVSHLGYQRLDTVVSPLQPVSLMLKPVNVVLKTVKVIHYDQDVLQASSQAGTIAFNPLKSANVPRIANDDLGNALLIIPGIDFLNGGSAGLSIRGGDPADNLVLFDGIPVLETSHLMGNMSVLNSKFVRQTFVSRGGFDASYGGRVAGLIELTGKSGRSSIPAVDISANMLNANVFAIVPVTGKFSVSAAWRRSYIDRWQNYLYHKLIEDVVVSEENNVTSTIFPVVKFQDVNAKLSYHPSGNLTVDLNVMYGQDEQSRDFELIQTKEYFRNESLWSKSLGMSLNLNWQAGDKWFHSFSAGFSTLEKDLVDETGELKEYTEVIPHPGQGKGKGKGLVQSRERTYSKDTHDIDNGFNKTGEYRAGWKSRITNGRSTVEGGFGMSSGSYSYRYYASRLDETLLTDSISSKANLLLLNAFLQHQLQLPENLRFRWGLRVNFNPENSAAYWQPRAGLEYEPVNYLKFYLLSGLYYQFLSAVRRFDSSGQFSRLWYLPDNDGTGVVSGVHYIAGSKFERNGWYADVEAYYKNKQGKINLFAELQSSGGNADVSYITRESSEKTSGIDVFIQKRHHIFNHMVGYSLSSTKEQMDGFFDNRWYPAWNDRTHRVKLTEMLRWRGWTLTGDWHYGSGLPVYNYIADQAYDDFSRSGYFSQVNAALVKTFTGSFYTFSAGASLLNIFDRKNIVEVNYLRFPSDSGSMTVRSDISALGFTPVFFINLKF